MSAGAQNWLLEHSKVAGQRAPAIVKLVQSAKFNGHEPWVALKDVLARLPMHPNSQHRRCCCGIAGRPGTKASESALDTGRDVVNAGDWTLADLAHGYRCFYPCTCFTASCRNAQVLAAGQP